MKIFNNFFRVNTISLFLLVLPYLVYNWLDLYYSPFFDFFKFLGFIFSLLIVDLIFQLFFIRFNKYVFIPKIFIFIVVIFFYGYYSILLIQEYTVLIFNFIPRGRYILLILILLLISSLIKKNTINYKYLNLYLLIFSIVNIFYHLYDPKQNKRNNINNLNSNFKSISIENKQTKPVILIITDEYSSPDELYKICNDSSLYQFSNNLKREGWNVNNRAFSNEISTIHSLSSLFNFNLSLNVKYSDFSVFEIGPNRLIKSALYDSLVSKNVKIINYGIFNLGNSQAFSDLFVYPKSFLSQLLNKSCYYYVKLNLDAGNLDGFSKASYPMEPHNWYIFNSMVKKIKSKKQKGFFVYSHLYMPHAPMKYYSEFKLPMHSNSNSYIAYWKFTNDKLIKLLSDLIRENNYRIILSGDHGYRDDKRINPNQTFMAFYGFSDKELKDIHSVQDLGSLIYACY